MLKNKIFNTKVTNKEPTKDITLDDLNNKIPLATSKKKILSKFQIKLFLDKKIFH